MIYRPSHKFPKLNFPKRTRAMAEALSCYKSMLNMFLSMNSEATWRFQMKAYKQHPEKFAIQILGTHWWSAQIEIALSIANNRRVAVKSANGVGKTFLAADLAIWYLLTHPNSIVLTTAPTWRQVRNLLWEEIARKFENAKTRLPGKLNTVRLTIDSSWYAMGLSASDSVTFQGFHAEHMLIILDEASGISEGIWEAVEGIAVGADNRILAIGNPLVTSGRFYRLFRDDSGWVKHTISAFDHPNVKGNYKARDGSSTVIRGCVTQESVHERIKEWCDIMGPAPPGAKELQFLNEVAESSPPKQDETEIFQTDQDEQLSIAESEIQADPNLGSIYSDHTDYQALIDQEQNKNRIRTGVKREEKDADNLHPIVATGPIGSQLSVSRSSDATPDTFNFRGLKVKPNNLFRARVLGQFPTAEPDTLIPLNWIEAAVRPIPNRVGFRHDIDSELSEICEYNDENLLSGYTRIAVDVARYGNDSTVIGMKTGSVMTNMETHTGCDTMQVAGLINRMAYDHHPESITIDSIGVGSGVVDRLRELGTEGVIPVNVSMSAHDQERFANKRAELYWGLRERFRLGDIVIPSELKAKGCQIEKLVEELASIKYLINSKGQIQMESKSDMKRRGLSSPDHADMLAMLYDGAWDFAWNSINAEAQYNRRPSEAQRLRDEMSRWL